MIITSEKLSTLKNGLPKRLTIDGQTKEYQSYYIPIDYLYYNNLNGRIATYIEEYNDQSSNEDLIELLNKDSDKYNDLIGAFIKKSSDDNEASFKKTKMDISVKGQQNPGVILSDGRIIDGNRRFTAIRELYKETGDPRFAYFEAVYLEAPDANDQDGWKRIKTLELFLQFNVDEKRDYNRIDFLVSFYRDTVDESTKVFDKTQYCHTSGLSPSDYEKNVAIIKVMLDYLEWRNKPKAFYILKNEKLDGPIEDIAAATKKMSVEEWNEIKDYIYHYMTHVQSGDRTRDIRELVKSAKTNGVLFREYKEKIDNPTTLIKLAKAVEDKDVKIQTPEESIKKIQEQKEVEKELSEALADAKLKDRLDNSINEPIKLIDDAIKYVSKVDIATVKKLDINKKKELNKKLYELDKALIGIKEVMNND